MVDSASARVLILLRQGDLAAAARLADTHQLPLSQARIHWPGETPPRHRRVLEPWRQQVKAKGWADERLQVMILQAVTLQAHGDRDEAVQVLVDALAFAEPGGFVRSFVDEGIPMAELLSTASAHLRMPAYVTTLLTVFDVERHNREHGRA